MKAVSSLSAAFAATLTAAAFAALLGLSTAAEAQDAAQTKLAEESAKAWLALTDAGKNAESWDQAAAAFKSAVSREKWAEAINGVRPPLGKVKSRTLVAAQYTKELPGAPTGEYVVIRFQTDFENKAGATELVTPMKEKDGSWKVSGYFIQ